MKNLILGGAGFIGQHLTKRLLVDGDEVTVIDNLKTSSITLDEYSCFDDFKFIKQDILDMSDDELLDIFEQHDRIYHLAGSVGVEYIDKHPSESLFNNTRLTEKLIPLFQRAGKQVVYSSTSEIYGNGPFHEEANASIGPSSKLRWGYACSKLMTEFMIRASNFPYTIVRFFNVVGPGQLGDYGMVLPRFVQSAKEGKDLTVYGTGEQVRSFCHVSDAIDCLIKVSEHSNQLFNIGNNTPITINELAERVIEESKSSSKIVHVSYEDAFSKNHGDINFRVPDLAKTIATVNYRPKFDVVDIINSML